MDQKLCSHFLDVVPEEILTIILKKSLDIGINYQKLHDICHRFRNVIHIAFDLLISEYYNEIYKLIGKNGLENYGKNKHDNDENENDDQKNQDDDEDNDDNSSYNTTRYADEFCEEYSKEWYKYEKVYFRLKHLIYIPNIPFNYNLLYDYMLSKVIFNDITGCETDINNINTEQYGDEQETCGRQIWLLLEQPNGLQLYHKMHDNLDEHGLSVYDLIFLTHSYISYRLFHMNYDIKYDLKKTIDFNVSDIPLRCKGSDSCKRMLQLLIDTPQIYYNRKLLSMYMYNISPSDLGLEFDSINEMSNIHIFMKKYDNLISTVGRQFWLLSEQNDPIYEFGKLGGSFFISSKWYWTIPLLLHAYGKKLIQFQEQKTNDNHEEKKIRYHDNVWDY